MRIGIGIDTGGTYTDAVVYDYDGGEVLCANKALTTKDELSRGIIAALDGLDAELCREAELVALSTTLATNACVENKGGRAKLLFIGMDEETMARVGKGYGFGGGESVFLCPGSGSFDGKTAPNVDWDALMRDTETWIKDAEGLGIVELYSMNNGGVAEKEAKERFTARRDIPTVCGSELFSGLDSVQRAAGTYLNARLVPVISDFLRAIKRALEERSISAPVMVVRSDGSLMSEIFARKRPVETVLSGPAASVLGGMRLSGGRDCLIVDMGGTTTDVSIVKNGEALTASGGVSVGEWRTFVKGVFIDTFGLGGDTAVRPGKRGLELETRRVEPISLFSMRYPFVKDELRTLLSETKYNTRPVYEYYYLVKEPSENADYNEAELRLCEALRKRPLMLREAADAAGVDYYHLEAFARLENEGVIMVAGLTPTDFMHITGDFSSYDAETARLAAAFLMNSLGYDWTSGEEMRKFAEKVFDLVRRRLYYNLVRILLEDKYPEIRKYGIDKQLGMIIERSWDEFLEGREGAWFTPRFVCSGVLVGIGAPTHIFLREIAEALGTECVIPPNAHVANAVGAVVSNISAKVTVEVRPDNTGGGVDGYFVSAADRQTKFEERQDAINAAVEIAETLAREEALRRGVVGKVSVTTKIEEKRGTAMFSSIDLGISVTATASGGTFS